MTNETVSEASDGLHKPREASWGRACTQMVLFLMGLQVLRPIPVLGQVVDAEPLSFDLPWEVHTEWPFTSEEARRRQEETAKDLGIPVDKSAILANGVTIDLVLIPPGRFMMGTPDPKEPEEKPIVGQFILGISGVLSLVLTAFAMVRAIRRRKKLQFTLVFMLVLTLCLGGCVWGGVRWWRAEEALLKFQQVKARPEAEYRNEKPAHFVTISRPFYLGKHEVTQAQYLAVTGGNPSYSTGDLTHPVDSVTWDETQIFCTKLAEKTGLTVRLPTEAEWEYACRAGTPTRFYSGDSQADLVSIGWHGGISKNTTQPQKKPNSFGLYDMHGNVWEWCHDSLGTYAAEAETDPQYSVEGRYRVARGGSRGHLPVHCRSASRGYGRPNVRYSSYGFRVAVDF